MRRAKMKTSCAAKILSYRLHFVLLHFGVSNVSKHFKRELACLKKTFQNGETDILDQ